MKLNLAEPKYFKDSISIISDLVSEARFNVKKEGIELIAMDPANVALVVFKLLPSAFVEFTLEKPVELSLNLVNLKQVLRRVNPADMLILEVVENKFCITIKGNSTRQFKLPILEVEQREQKSPALQFLATIELDSTVLTAAIEDCDIVSEAVSFMAVSEKFIVSGEGDWSTAKVELNAGDDINVKVGTEDKIKSKYSIEYLKKMVSASKIADRVLIKFSRDYPLKLEYTTKDRVQMQFILAPRVENS